MRYSKGKGRRKGGKRRGGKRRGGKTLRRAKISRGGRRMT